MSSTKQSEENLQELRKLVGHYDAAVYRAVKEGRVKELSREGQILAKVMQEHLGLPHIHNALEFADVREGELYIVNGVNPLAHLATHAAVEEMIEGGNTDTKAAYEKLITTGVDKHHAVHILGGVFVEFYFEAVKAGERGESPNKARVRYERALRKICTDSAFRKKLTRKYIGGHPALEAEE